MSRTLDDCVTYIAFHPTPPLSYQTAPSSKSSGFGILLISSTSGAPLFAGANGSFFGADAATEAPDAAADVDADAAGVEAGTEFIGLLDVADSNEAVVDAHLIIFASAVALFACRTSSLFPVNAINT